MNAGHLNMNSDKDHTFLWDRRTYTTMEVQQTTRNK